MVHRNKTYYDKGDYPLADKYRKLLSTEDVCLIVRRGHWVSALTSGQTRQSNPAERALLESLDGSRTARTPIALSWINYLKVQPAVRSPLFAHIIDINEFSKWDSDILEKHFRLFRQLLDRKIVPGLDWHQEILDVSTYAKWPEHEIARVWFKYQAAMPPKYRAKPKDLSLKEWKLNHAKGSFERYKYSGLGVEGEDEKAQTEDWANWDGNRLR